MSDATQMKPADVTLQQLGGSRRLKLMVNGRDFFSENDGQTLYFKFSSCRKASVVKITLNALDLYDIEFIKPGRLNKKTWEMSPNKTTGEFANVYAEDLKRIFEEFTGLYLSI